MSFRDKGPSNRLYEACQKGKIKKVRELVKDPNIRNFINDGSTLFYYTPLHEATNNRKQEIIEVLLKNGANVDSTTNSGYTPLHIAASIGDLKCIGVLLKYNANVKLKNDFGQTPCQLAEQNSQKGAARLLKTAGQL